MDQEININQDEIQNIIISTSTPQTIRLSNLSLESIDVNQNENQEININEETNQIVYINENGTPLITDVRVNGISVVSDTIAYVSVPTKTSELTNDSGFINNNVNNLINYTKTNDFSAVAFSGNYNDLMNTPTIPTKTSNLTNDSGFITNTVNNLTNYTLTSNLSTVATSGNYNDLSNLPSIPTQTSELNNDSGFITDSTQSLEYYTLTASLSDVATSGNYNDLVNKPTIPTSTSQLNNDSGFITDSYHDNTKQDTLVSGTNIKTINNESILGSGNISISGGSATDVQINGTSITSSNVANIITESAYDDTTNKIATMSDIPSVPTKTSELTNDSGFITSSSLPQDSGWQTATLTSDFELYSSTYANKYRKIGKTVYVQGGVKPTAQISANLETTIFTLPSGYRPSNQVSTMCQGSGMNKWCLTVNTNGKVTVQRYGTTSNIAIPTNAWLSFSISFAID